MPRKPFDCLRVDRRDQERVEPQSTQRTGPTVFDHELAQRAFHGHLPHGGGAHRDLVALVLESFLSARTNSWSTNLGDAGPRRRAEICSALTAVADC